MRDVPIHSHNMIIQARDTQTPFTTADGSTIRSLLDLTNAPVENQSLAEASLPQEAARWRSTEKCARSARETRS